MGGLVVIDFIDMQPVRNQRAVEQRMSQALEMDRARVQLGRISRFGLLEMSRQRLRPSLGETTSKVCPRCSGQGTIRSTKSIALSILRLVEEEAQKEKSAEIRAITPVKVATYLLNEKRKAIASIESRSNVRILIAPNEDMVTPHYEVQRLRNDNSEGFETSYKIVGTQQDEGQLFEPVKPVALAQPAVKQLTPAQPAPVAAKPKQPGLFVKWMAILKALFAPAPKKVSKAKGQGNQRRNGRNDRRGHSAQNRRGSNNGRHRNNDRNQRHQSNERDDNRQQRQDKQRKRNNKVLDGKQKELQKDSKQPNENNTNTPEPRPADRKPRNQQRRRGNRRPRDEKANNGRENHNKQNNVAASDTTEPAAKPATADAIAKPATQHEKAAQTEVASEKVTVHSEVPKPDKPTADIAPEPPEKSQKDEASEASTAEATVAVAADPVANITIADAESDLPEQAETQANTDDATMPAPNYQRAGNDPRLHPRPIGSVTIETQKLKNFQGQPLNTQEIAAVLYDPRPLHRPDNDPRIVKQLENVREQAMS